MKIIKCLKCNKKSICKHPTKNTELLPNEYGVAQCPYCQALIRFKFSWNFSNTMDFSNTIQKAKYLGTLEIAPETI